MLLSEVVVWAVKKLQTERPLRISPLGYPTIGWHKLALLLQRSVQQRLYLTPTLTRLHLFTLAHHCTTGRVRVCLWQPQKLAAALTQPFKASVSVPESLKAKRSLRRSWRFYLIGQAFSPDKQTCLTSQPLHGAPAFTQQSQKTEGELTAAEIGPAFPINSFCS